MINWRVRIRNKLFWLTLVPAVLVLICAIADVAGIKLDFTDLGAKLTALVEAVFAVLSILGIVVDPTTEGVSDSLQAMTYEYPKPLVPATVYEGKHETGVLTDEERQQLKAILERKDDV